ncbi:hypothetical protein [Streptomyces sp. NPDC088726]|uniref:hypothetical protein n=1 Tax=Streptomyces sp. NPDC088726 TaxID=3365874 RepID=UPI0037F3F996
MFDSIARPTSAHAARSVLLAVYGTLAGAEVDVREFPDGTLSSSCTGCGEWAWTMQPTAAQAQEHARNCCRRPRPHRN